jgi:hypothetical protein
MSNGKTQFDQLLIGQTRENPPMRTEIYNDLSLVHLVTVATRYLTKRVLSWMYRIDD